MTVLVTGSSGHLGEALMRTLQAQRRETIGIDVQAGAFTHQVGSIADRAFVRRCMKGVTTVLHAATLHKPHVATHSRQDFVDVNISGTLNLLEEAAAAGVTAFVFTSTTSVFGDALVPPPGEPAAWITEDVTAGAEKHLWRHQGGGRGSVPAVRAQSFACAPSCCAPRASFPKRTTIRAVREAYADANIKTNEFLYRRVDIEDVVSAHLLAAEHAPAARFREIHHQRHHAILAPTTWRNCATTRRLWSAVTCRTMRPNLPGAAGR